MQAAAESRADDARVLFRESLALFPTAAAGYNLAVVCRDAGDVADAFETADGLLEGRYGQLDDERRAAATELRDQLRARVALVDVSVRGPPDALLRIDDRPAQGPVHALEPGSHRIRAEAPDGRTAERTLEVHAGESRQLELVIATVLPTRPPPTAGPRPIDDPADDTSLTGSPWFWVGVGAVLVTAAVIVLWVTLPTDDLPPAASTFITLH